MQNELEYRKRCYQDLGFFARNELKIRTKSGKVEPFTFNKAQNYIHEKLEQQLHDTGRVRAIILKARQQGCSTYVAARFYHKTTHSKGFKTFILTHLQEATDNLFGMVKRFHDNSIVAPKASNNSAKELVYEDIDSEYKVGTAGSKAVGRSQTIQLFHGSEVAFWQNDRENVSGIIQAIADLPETEVILESTANGIQNYFYEACMEAGAKYQLIFIPWFWEEGYTSPSFEPLVYSEKEIRLKELYNLTDGQLVWRREKVKELRDEKLFEQEYPSCVEDAFITSVDNPLIPIELVQDAMRAWIDDLNNKAPVVLGVDVARGGGDKSAFCIRQGRKVHKIYSVDTDDTMQIVGQVIDLDKFYNFKKVFVDVIGVGAGVVDRLKEMGYGNRVIGVNSSETKSLLHSDRYSNKRAEMWGELLEWLNNKPVQLPNSETLKFQLTCIGKIYDSNGKLKLQDKSELKKSPDEADSLVLTFAFPVANAVNNVKFERRDLGFV